MDRSPQRPDAIVEPGNGFLIGEAAGNGQHDLLVVAQPETLRLGLIHARHVAHGTAGDQRFDHSGAKRAGAAGDHDVTIAEIHSALPEAVLNRHHHPSADRGKIIASPPNG